MYYAEKLLENLTFPEMLAMLQNIYDDDYYLGDFKQNNTLKMLLQALLDYDIVFVTQTDHRIILTPVGEKLLSSLNQKLIYLK